MNLFKKLLKRKIILLIVFSLLFFGMFIPDYISKNNLTVFAAKNPVLTIKKDENLNLPVRIKIPKMEVDTLIESVGLTKDGAMDVPLGPINTAWFNLGTIPGELGSSVIDGHAGWKNGVKAVFDDLNKLKKGDLIYVENGNGDITTFVVREIKVYDPKSDATNIFFSNDKKSHLNLIACTGIWDKKLKSHSKRLVVFADKK